VVINPNGLACVVLIALSFWHYLLPATRPGALVYLALAPIGVYALILTGSRSGFLGLAVVVTAIWMNSKHKIILGTVLLAAVMLVVPQLSANTVDRYLSIVDSDTKNAVTAHDRWTGIQADMAVAMRRPIFGHGLGTTVEANANFQGRPLPSHNLYVEVVQETGFVGLAIFLAFMWAVISKLIRVTRQARRSSTSDFSTRLANALQVWLAMELIFSFASYGLSSYGWYLLAGLTGAVSRLRSPLSEVDGFETKEHGRLASVCVGAVRPDGGGLWIEPRRG
jgi:O-antigen ligase